MVLVVEKEDDGDLVMEEVTTHDPISRLPDHILAHVLSLLFTTSEAVCTGILSRRWRDMWKYTHNLNFNHYFPPGINNLDFPNFVTRALDLHQGTSIHRFSLWFNYMNGYAHQVDSWIHYAVTHNARVIRFSLEPRYEEEPYKLPPCFLDFPSLEMLCLQYCKLEIPPSSRFSSLMEVSLIGVRLEADAVKNLTSTSPCLQHLSIHRCTWGGGIHIESTKLEVADVQINGGCAGDFTIRTPNLTKLYLSNRIAKGRYLVKDLFSIVEVTLMFDEMFEIGEGVYNEIDGDRLIELLRRLRHVQLLRLFGWCIQVLAIRGVMGRVQCLNNPPLDIVELNLATNFDKWDLPGIACLLKICPKLQKLFINIGDRKGFKFNSDVQGKYDFDESEYWSVQEKNSSCVIEHLETIEIKGFMRCGNLYSEESETSLIEKVLKLVKSEIRFIKFLLKNSVVLKKMTITTIKEEDFNQLVQKSEPLIKAIQELFVFPKASPKAEIVFNYRLSPFFKVFVWE